MLEAWYNSIPSCHWLRLTSSTRHKNKNMPKYNFESQKRNFHTKCTMHSKAVLPMLSWIFVSLVITCTITCGAVTCRELPMGLMVCLNFHMNNTFNHFYANDNKNWPNNKRYLLHISMINCKNSHNLSCKIQLLNLQHVSPFMCIISVQSFYNFYKYYEYISNNWCNIVLLNCYTCFCVRNEVWSDWLIITNRNPHPRKFLSINFEDEAFAFALEL